MSDAPSADLVGYEEDFAAWADEQARLLRADDVQFLDLDNLAEQIESLAGRERREIRTQRRELDEVLEDGPGLRRRPTAVLPTAYAKGREEALEETGLYRLPRACPWTIEQVMSPEFLPD